jgi:hypothetical protein
MQTLLISLACRPDRAAFYDSAALALLQQKADLLEEELRRQQANQRLREIDCQLKYLEALRRKEMQGGRFL